MWLMFARVPPPDVPYWPGRRLLAALDALVWPAGWISAIMHVPFDAGVAGNVCVAVVALGAARRLRRAVWSNHRYRFTTWRWGRVLGMMLLLGWALKTEVGRAVTVAEREKAFNGLRQSSRIAPELSAGEPNPMATLACADVAVFDTSPLTGTTSWCRERILGIKPV